jgi:hypothetical protein
MFNEERLGKLKQAYDLLTEIEFSYPEDHPHRKEMFEARFHSSYGIVEYKIKKIRDYLKKY